MERKVETVMYGDKPLHIRHVSEDGSYVLATFADDKQTKVFKLDSSELSLSEKDKATLTKINPNT